MNFDNETVFTNNFQTLPGIRDHAGDINSLNLLVGLRKHLVHVLLYNSNTSLGGLSRDNQATITDALEMTLTVCCGLTNNLKQT